MSSIIGNNLNKEFMKILIIAILYFTLQFPLLAQESEPAIITMRRCLLLPISDELNNSIGFKVFEKLEKYLRDSNWCYYRPNSEILNILNKYRQNLQEHLNNPQVLETISEKTKSGSLIRIMIKPNQSGVNLKISIFGNNGSDLYFNETTTLKEIDIELISQALINWLNEYQKQIPYDGLVQVIIGDQVSIDAGADNGLFQGTNFKVKRPTRKKAHPLLKEIVDYETTEVATGTVFHSNSTLAQGKIKGLSKNERVQPGDWIIKEAVQEQEIYTDNKKENNHGAFGKLGEASVGVSLNSVSTTVTNSGSVKKLSGPGLGVYFGSELWVTRIFWSSIYLDKALANLKQSEGSFSNSSYTAGPSTFKLKFGYKYLPLGFFYGPQLDVAIGYGRFGFNHDNSTQDGITSFSYKGPLFSIRGNVPLKGLFRIGAGLDVLISPSYSEEMVIYGESESTSSYDLMFFTKYNYSGSITIDGELLLHSSSADFPNQKKISNKRAALKVGATFSF